MKKRIILWAVGIVVVLLIAFGIFSRIKHKPALPSMGHGPGVAYNVQVVPVSMGDISSVSTLTGSVSANQTATVSSQVSGQVQSVAADVGQTVRAGEVIAQLDPSNLEHQLAQSQAAVQMDQANVQSAQAALNQAQVDYQRNQQLYISGAEAPATLDGYKLKLAQAKAQLQVEQAMLAKDQAGVASLQQQIGEMSITSPITGVVATKGVQVGQQVSTQSTLFTVVQIDPVQVTVDVPDTLIAAVHPGTAAKITVPELGTAVFQGTVAQVSPVLDTATHAYPVQIQVRNPKASLLPGMTATVVFSGLHQKEGIVIPVQAVLETPQGSEVYTVKDGIAHLHVIQLGAVSSNQAVVESGLAAGDQVVVNGESLLSDGSHVNVVQNASQAGVQGMINQVKQGADK